MSWVRSAARAGSTCQSVRNRHRDTCARRMVQQHLSQPCCGSVPHLPLCIHQVQQQLPCNALKRPCARSCGVSVRGVLCSCSSRMQARLCGGGDCIAFPRNFIWRATRMGPVFARDFASEWARCQAHAERASNAGRCTLQMPTQHGRESKIVPVLTLL